MFILFALSLFSYIKFWFIDKLHIFQIIIVFIYETIFSAYFFGILISNNSLWTSLLTSNENPSNSDFGAVNFIKKKTNFF